MNGDLFKIMSDASEVIRECVQSLSVENSTDQTEIYSPMRRCLYFDKWTKEQREGMCCAKTIHGSYVVVDIDTGYVDVVECCVNQLE